MYIRFRHLVAAALSCCLFFTGECLAQTTELVSVNSLNVQGNSLSQAPSISASGRFVAFESYADNLVPVDTNGTGDIFVHDRQTGTTELVSVDSFGTQANSGSKFASISADGRYVAFESYADNLVLGDLNATSDIFVHDRQTGITELISVDASGLQANSWSGMPTISPNGNFVTFNSYADNLVPVDTNSAMDIFVHDLQTGATELVSVNSLGAQANSWSTGTSSISADGRYVAFTSNATNFAPGDTNVALDVFVHDRQTGLTDFVSVDSLGVHGNGESMRPSISADGRLIAFQSDADNLVPNDTNWRTDIFIHDRLTGTTSRVSVDSLGTQGNELSNGASISADGTCLAFSSRADNLVPGDTNAKDDTFVHDLQTGVTERVSVNSIGTQGYSYSYSPCLSTDGRYVAFPSSARNLVPRDTNWSDDIFLHDRWDGLGENSIYLSGPTTSPVLTPLALSWQTTRGNSAYWLTCSRNRNGSVIGGHTFDIGLPAIVLATGNHSTNGMGSFTSQPIPASATGQTIFFEVAARDGAGILFDSNLHSVIFY